MRAALVVEARKLVRSRVVLVATLLLVLLVPLLAYLLVVAADSGVGVLAGKGQALVDGEGWDAYLSALAQVIAAAVFVGAGVVVAWAFGREHADRTFGALFALPVARRDIAAAKFVVLAVWGLVASLGVTAVAVLLGVVGGVEPGAAVPPVAELGRPFVAAITTTLLALPVALVASVGRGHLPGIGAVVVITATAQVSVFLGAGAWFPFAVPGVWAIADDVVLAAPGPAEVALAALTVLAGAAATVWWWAHAEVA